MNVSQLAQKLIQFESTHTCPKEMQKCLDFCEAFFADDNVFKKKFVHNDIASLLIQTQNTKNIDILLLGHIDTVPGAPHLFEGAMRDGKLFGRGSLDMKAFVATSMFVMKELLEEKINVNIGLLIVTDEELGGTYGAQKFVENNYRAKVVLVPDDGNSIDAIVSETKHVVHVTITTQGREAHACRPWDGVNAIEQLYGVFNKLKSHFTYPNTPYPWVNTINLGTLEGGTATNEVAGEAEMSIDIRLTKDTSKKELIGWLNQAVKGTNAKYSIDMEALPIRLDKENGFVKKYKKHVEETIKKKTHFTQSGGATDGRFFIPHGSIVITHQGNGEGCQGDDEYVEISTLEQLVTIQKNFIKECCN